MCLAVYIASKQPLPLIPFQREMPTFNVRVLNESEETALRQYLTLLHICEAGSDTHCGCGFNHGRDKPEDYTPEDRADSLESSKRLAQYVRENCVE